MTLMGLIVVIAIIILILWMVQTYMPPPWKTPILAIVVLLALIFLIVSVWPGAANIRIR
jgi:hypothetical protein